MFRLKIKILTDSRVASYYVIPSTTVNSNCNQDAVFKTSPMNLLNERTLKGTFFGNYKPRSDIPSVVEKYMNKELEVEKFITHEVPFSEINKAFDLMLKGEGLRCIIRMDA
ncbi:alcohol dehydrogenase 1-like [Helianthus annuus]|uniref:alcohol dehydrogenase 1-like n=1 Tax=Helianthus annuus TaxID=4232 RepID=UPI000B8F6087|nr:alcohol dehydrogenase 1-like [Helianthus annuus]